MPTFINLTNAAIDLNVNGDTRLTVEPDGRQAYLATQNDTLEGIILATDENGVNTLLKTRAQRITGAILARPTDTLDKCEAFPSQVADTYYLVSSQVALALRRADVGWIDNTSDPDNSTFYPGRAG